MCEIRLFINYLFLAWYNNSDQMYISNYQPTDDGNIFGWLSSTFASVYIIIMFRLISSQIGIPNIILLVIFNQIK